MRPIVIHRDAGTLAVPTGHRTMVAAIGLYGSALSPWYVGKIEYQNRLFSSVAQLVAWQRAWFFNAESVAGRILITRDPRALRDVSRCVPGDETMWMSELDKVMPVAMRELVTQNTDSLVELLATGGSRIAFAVQGDRIWGTGLSTEDHETNPSKPWPGKNRLGTILEELRDGYCRELLPLFKRSTDHRPLDTTAITEVRKLVEACFALAEDVYDRKFPRPAIRFDLTGTTAGQARWRRGRTDQDEIRFNPVLLSENWMDFRDRTVPHEVAHLVTRDLYGEQARAHGAEWKSVMRTFGCDETRCHSYSTVNVSKDVGRRAVMCCACRLHLVPLPKSERAGLRCRACGKSVRFVIRESALIDGVTQLQAV